MGNTVLKSIKVSRHKRKVREAPKARNVNTTEPVGFDWRYSITNITNGTVVSNKSSGFQVLGNNTRVGVSNPNWKDQVRLGSNATTPFSGVLWSGDTDRSFWSYYASYQQFNANGSLAQTAVEQGGAFLHYPILPSITVPSASVVTEVHNRLIRRFVDEVNAAQSSENLTGRSIKHFKHDVHSTIHPMAGIRAKINSYLTSLEKVSYGKLKGPSLLSAISQSYLEFKFGVEPFVDDITAIMVDMCIKDRKRNPSEPVKASAHVNFAGSTSRSVVSVPTAFSPYQNVLSTSVYSERLKGAVRTGINDDGRLGIIQDNRLLPKDWAPTAFSILPYAWMVNYFTNIRDIIDAASLRYSDLVWTSFNTRVENIVTYSDVVLNGDLIAPFPPRYLNIVKSTTGGNATFAYKLSNRSVITPSDLRPSFEWQIPTTPTPWVNMMAAFGGRIFNVVSRLIA